MLGILKIIIFSKVMGLIMYLILGELVTFEGIKTTKHHDLFVVMAWHSLVARVILCMTSCS